MEAENNQWTPSFYRIPFKESEKWKTYLQENGFVVVANYLSSETCQKYVDDFWNIMQTLSQGKLDKNDPKTQNLAKNYPVVLHGGMIQYLGHTQPQWQLRTLCKPIFQQIWETENLKSSFDGFCFMNGKRKYLPRENDAFLHVDQSPTKNFLWSYQGVICLTNSLQNQGGFVCIPQSHKEHQNYFKKKKLLELKENWYLVPDEDKRKHPFETVLKVNTQAGDFILFDSRTFHCNTVPTVDSLRVCTYICMIPSQKVSKEIEEKRKKGFKERRTSNHHPGDGFKIFPKVPRYVNNPKNFEELLEKINCDYKLTKEQLELI